ncbi:GAF domain-containing protein [Pseudonocardia oroxyli]|uniref:GAF domain-containing protein n=1 Tax=Pseudonocardia oroxyli TaxID=366584 RepID=A0A1G7SRS8_PSEOR|nr:GAF domain-containing protein [Pseudonocardia oroxyli]
MVDDPQTQVIQRVLAQRLRQMQHVTGLPVVFGGAVQRRADRTELLITELRGTMSDTLSGLQVRSGRGLGGTALLRGTACRVNDYATTTAITHDFDRHVVHHEKIKSVVALPIRVHGHIGGIVYGAVRADRPIGDVAVQRASAFAGTVEREIQSLTARPLPSGAARIDAAVDELAEIARTTADPVVRARLRRIAAELAGTTGVPTADPATAGTAVHLAPREIELLRLIAVGKSNREAAEALNLSPETVKAYLRSAMRRLEVGNRTAAVHAARAQGLL